MGEDYANVRLEELNPTFLFTWKGRREKDEQRYHCHDYLEIACPERENTGLMEKSIL